ncbi:MAG: polyphosphate kinase 2 family protein [Candidatus Korobacteraceae bacterium]|jgi:PPK2 family polyphosphate:nucleotide phosphotransferase
MKKLAQLAEPYRVEVGNHFRLQDFDPGDTGEIRSKQHAAVDLQRGVDQLRDWQDKLYAQHQWAVLLIFQAMDAAGKDGTIKHVMSGVNPAGCEVYSFKAPSGIESNHDYLWRTTLRLPECGRIGIFNRSYYEEVLVVRVHEALLKERKIPPSLIGKHIWNQRFEDICGFERYLSHNGIVIRKFFLHLSKAEQRKRFLARLEEPEKHWKFSAADINEREHWNDYMAAYEDMIRHTASPWAPWYVVPADHKWFTRIVVAAAIVDALEGLDLSYPKVDPHKHKQLEEARCFLQNGKS